MFPHSASFFINLRAKPSVSTLKLSLKMESKSVTLKDVHIEQSMPTARDAHIAIHTDTYDIDEDALGNNLPRHYYMSPGFIGTVTVSPI